MAAAKKFRGQSSAEASTGAPRKPGHRRRAAYANRATPNETHDRARAPGPAFVLRLVAGARKVFPPGRRGVLGRCVAEVRQVLRRLAQKPELGARFLPADARQI